jgi:hypothetical protein
VDQPATGEGDESHFALIPPSGTDSRPVNQITRKRVRLFEMQRIRKNQCAGEQK